MKNLIKIILTIVIIIVLSIVSIGIYKTKFNSNNTYIKENQNIIKVEQDIIKIEQDKVEPVDNLEEREIPKWVTVLPKVEFNDILEEEDSYTYNYSTEITQSGTIARSLNYSKKDNNQYEGTMKLVFSDTENTHIETIPKSFASHVDQLDFSTEPSRVINPDPVVEFTNITGELEIQSKESVAVKSIEDSMEEQIIKKESEICEGLELENGIACFLGLVSKYRDTETMQKELKDMNLSLGGNSFETAIYVIKEQSFRKCDLFPHGSERDMCYEYGYQVLITECNVHTGLAYRNCVRKLSLSLPNMEDRRLLCHHIEDKAMYDECRGEAPMSVCDEIENEDQRILCQVNIAKTEGKIESCDKVTDSDAQDICRAMLGMDKNNEKYCDLVKDEYFSGECRMKVALLKNDKKMCDKITHKSQKDLCYMSFLIHDKKATQSMCNNMNDRFLKDMCEMVLAIQEKDYKKCETIKDEFNRQACYFAVAVSTKDTKLCEKVIEVDLKKDCLKLIQEPEEPSISCSDVPAPVCPLIKKFPLDPNPIIPGENGRETICSYLHVKENVNFPLYREEEKKDNKLDGMYKLYHKSGGIFVARQYSKGRVNGYSIKCSEIGELTSCRMSDNGKSLGSCMPKK